MKRIIPIACISIFMMACTQKTQTNQAEPGVIINDSIATEVGPTSCIEREYKALAADNSKENQTAFFNAFPKGAREFENLKDSMNLAESETDLYNYIDAFGNLTETNDTLYCIRLLNLAIGLDYEADAINQFQQLLQTKMGFIRKDSKKNADNNLCDIILLVLSKTMKGDQMRFWQFYFSSLNHEEDNGAGNTGNKAELSRLTAKMEKDYPDMINTVVSAHDHFANGLMFDDWYPYNEEYILSNIRK